MSEQQHQEDLQRLRDLRPIMEDMRNESLKQGIKEGMREAALRVLTAGKYALEEIASISGHYK